MTPILWMLLGAGCVWGGSLGLLGLLLLSSHHHSRTRDGHDRKDGVLR